MRGREYATDPTDVVIRIPEIVMGDEGPAAGRSIRPTRRARSAANAR